MRSAMPPMYRCGHFRSPSSRFPSPPQNGVTIDVPVTVVPRMAMRQTPDEQAVVRTPRTVFEGPIFTAAVACRGRNGEVVGDDWRGCRCATQKGDRQDAGEQHFHGPIVGTPNWYEERA